MSRKRLPLYKVRELLKLKYARGLSIRQTAYHMGIGIGTVHDYLTRIRADELIWQEVLDLPDDLLEAKLFPPSSTPSKARPVPDWSLIAAEQKSRGVTLRLLWDEYRLANPEGLAYSQFCKRFKDEQDAMRPDKLQIL